MYIDESTLEYGHNPCPNCQSQGRDSSGDNLMYYGEGQGYYCFGGCGLVKLSDEYLDENSVNKVITRGEKVLITQKDKDALINKALTPEQVKEIEAKTSPTINVKYRGVPSSVYESLGVRWEGGGNTGQPISMYYPVTVTEDGKPRVVGYKVRRHPKDFYSIGYVGKLGGFLNQSNAVADTLIIVSGEVDLASAIHGLEMDRYRKSYNVVSSPLGEDSTAMMIKLNYDWVNSHKKIVVCMDNDEAGEKAFEKVTPEDLVVLVDHHKPTMAIAPSILEQTQKVVIIDHHRRGDEFPKDPILVYIEPYASSASELVTELFEYVSTEGNSINRIEATAMLGGIIVDTNNFSLRTGSRTFDAASYLQSVGANTTTIQRILKEDPKNYMQRMEIIKTFEFVSEGMAVANAAEDAYHSQVVAAQAADTMLSMTDVEASFVIIRLDENRVGVSARSLGQINVQRVMEKLGGGGHLTNAATQIENHSIAEVKVQLTEAIQELTN